MKKVLIIAIAIVFAASASVMASTQNQTGKIQPRKATTSVKAEAQKPAAKVENKAVAVDENATQMVKPTAKKVSKTHKMKPAVKATEVNKTPVQKAAEPSKGVKPVTTPKK